MDLQFVRLLDLVPLRQVLPLRVEIPTLDIFGQDFRKVVSVYMNGIQSPDVVVVNQGRLWAQIPDSLVGSKISSVNVYSSGLIMTERTQIQFSLEGNRKTAGLLQLIQLFVKLLLQSPRTDSFDVVGGGYLAHIGTNIESRQDIENKVRDGVDVVTQAIRARQQGDTRIPLDQRLQSADVVGLRVVAETGQVDVRVAISNQAGQTGLSLVSTEAVA